MRRSGRRPGPTGHLDNRPIVEVDKEPPGDQVAEPTRNSGWHSGDGGQRRREDQARWRGVDLGMGAGLVCPFCFPWCALRCLVAQRRAGEVRRRSEPHLGPYQAGDRIDMIRSPAINEHTTSTTIPTARNAKIGRYEF